MQFLVGMEDWNQMCKTHNVSNILHVFKTEEKIRTGEYLFKVGLGI